MGDRGNLELVLLGSFRDRLPDCLSSCIADRKQSMRALKHIRKKVSEIDFVKQGDIRDASPSKVSTQTFLMHYSRMMHGLGLLRSAIVSWSISRCTKTRMLKCPRSASKSLTIIFHMEVMCSSLFQGASRH